MIDKLGLEADYHWRSKLLDMLKDIRRSKEYTLDFNKQYNDPGAELEFNVNVCTTGAWPNYSREDVKMPIDIAGISSAFSKFYTNTFPSRRLRYLMYLGEAELLVSFNENCEKILVCSTYQMMVLLMFNHNKIWTFKQIMMMTGIPRSELGTAILSMCHPKVKILKRNPPINGPPVVQENHQFRLNQKYKNARDRVSVPTLHIKSIQSDEEHSAEQKLRRHQVCLYYYFVSNHLLYSYTDRSRDCQNYESKKNNETY